MLIEDLIRLGRPLLNGEMKPEDVLGLITSVNDVRVKNFYRNVFVIDVPTREESDPLALPRQVFGSETDDRDFEVAERQAIGAPFFLPSGGNPLNGQGRYGLPVYPCYDPHLRGFGKSAESALDFLQGRLARTPAFSLTDAMKGKVAKALHQEVARTDFEGTKKVLGVLILLRRGPDGFYDIVRGIHEKRIGTLPDGHSIVPNFQRILDSVWTATVEEGREGGSRLGPCSFTGTGDKVVSVYCKAWPWAFPTWTCPLPNGGDEKMLVQGIGVSADTYRALTLGACIFNKLTKRVSHLVIPEIFSPNETRPGKEQAQRRKISDLPPIYGSAYLLPILDHWESDAELQRDFVEGVRGLLGAKQNDPKFEDRYMTTIIGFEAMLPPLLGTDDFRLTLVYFSGDYTRGDIHLRAYIQDVIPSTLTALRDLARKETTEAMQLLRALMPWMSEKQAAYFGQCYASAPYRLARAYGGGYLWQQLETLLHRRLLRMERVTNNAASRMGSLSPQWPESRYALFEEVSFYLSFLQFLERANHEIAKKKEGTVMPMRPWRELIRVFERDPVDTIEFRDDKLAELGFACGLLIRRFSTWYAGEFKRKDYLKERVLTFGADLSPRQVWVLGVRGIRDVAGKFDRLRLAVDFGQLGYYPKEERKQHQGDYARRLGLVLSELERHGASLDRHRDEFMTGFWAGYSLQGYDRPKMKTPTKQTTTAIATKE